MDYIKGKSSCQTTVPKTTISNANIQINDSNGTNRNTVFNPSTSSNVANVSRRNIETVENIINSINSVNSVNISFDNNVLPNFV